MRRVATLLVAAALASAALPAPTRAAQKSIWGPLTIPSGTSAFPLYRDLGVDTFQLTLNWDQAAADRPTDAREPTDPAYAWPAEVDSAIDGAGRSGLGVAVLVAGSPAWANGSRPSIWAPDAPSDFADFVVAAARRYPAVRHWMIWGEPNKGDRFQPNAENDPKGPRAYALLLDAAYEGLKEVSTDNTVIGGMTWTGGDVTPSRFLDWMRLPSGRPPRLDWFGHNPFPFRFPDLARAPAEGGYRDISDLDTFGAELRAAYGREVPLWLSEFNVQSDKSSRLFEDFVTREEQARYLTAGYEIADTLPGVAGLGWFTLLDEPPAPGSANLGILDSEGNPKPAFEAFRAAPSRRHRPGVRVERRTRVGARRLVVAIEPRASGQVNVSLVRRGRTIRRYRRMGSTGVVLRLRLRVRRLKKDRYAIVVRAPRGERVTRRVVLR